VPLITPVVVCRAWRAVQIGLFLFNDPLFLFQFVRPHVFLVWIASLFQIYFLCTLLLYWIVEFGAPLRRQTCRHVRV
jgi:hypothetical protein